MTFWYVLRNGLNFFKLFHFHLGLIMTPHVLYDHMTYVYSFSHVLFFTRSHGQEKSLSYYDLFRLWSITLWMHSHPHFLLLPLQSPHPYTHHQYPHNRAPPGEECVMAPMYEEEEDLGYMVEDYVQPKLRPAKVGLVLPSNPSARPVEQGYREPLLDQARFGRQ